MGHSPRLRRRRLVRRLFHRPALSPAGSFTGRLLRLSQLKPSLTDLNPKARLTPRARLVDVETVHGRPSQAPPAGSCAHRHRHAAADSLSPPAPLVAAATFQAIYADTPSAIYADTPSVCRHGGLVPRLSTDTRPLPRPSR